MIPTILLALIWLWIIYELTKHNKRWHEQFDAGEVYVDEKGKMRVRGF